MGKIAGVYSSPRSHFFGSAFTVRVLLSSHRFDRHLTPSVMMNYADSTGFVRPPRAALWSGSAIAPGSAFDTAIDELLNRLEERGKWSVILFGGALAAYIATKWWQRQRFLRLAGHVIEL